MRKSRGGDNEEKKRWRARKERGKQEVKGEDKRRLDKKKKRKVSKESRRE